MKVAHVTPSFHPARVYGGTTESVYQLCRAVARQGVDVRVLTTNANGPHAVLNVPTDQDIVLEDGLRVRYTRRLWPESISGQLLSVLKSTLDWCDVAHLTAVYSYPTFPTLWLARQLGKPVVWSSRGALQRWKGSRKVLGKALWDRACHLVTPKNTVLHVTSVEEGEMSLKRFPGLRAVVIPNGVQASPPIPPANDRGTVRAMGNEEAHCLPKGEGGRRPGEAPPLRFLFLGRLDPKKGLENLLTACRLMQKKAISNWKLTIAGGGSPGYEKHLRHEIERLNLLSEVSLVGPVEGPAKEKIFSDSDVVIVPSFTENFCIVVAEALAHGVPVITSRGTPWAQVENKQCGLWVENDPETLCEAMVKVRKMPLTEMGQRGRVWMESEFNWDSIGRQMGNLYKDLLKR